LKLPTNSFFFRINRYDRFVRSLRSQELHSLRIDVKLGVAIDVPAAFSCLAVRLQTIAHATQKIADNHRANRVPLLR
jgi:hypothetical protein